VIALCKRPPPGAAVIAFDQMGPISLRPTHGAGWAAKGRSERHRATFHRAISNLKAWILGTHRGVSKAHLPVYLDEYVFRHNRRRTPMAAFQTLLGLGALHEPRTYDEITQRDQAAA
jgi:hypothetical protein